MTVWRALAAVEHRMRDLEGEPQAVAAPFARALQVSSAPLPPPALQSLVTSTAHRYGVDPALVEAIVDRESGGDGAATSGVGAMGLMQLMPATAATLGVTDPYDRAQNIDGGTRYLRSLLDRFGGDVTRAVAAYNAGPQAVERYGGVPPYSETQRYVDAVLDTYARTRANTDRA